MPTTITAGVTTYSIVSATPVVKPPHGPIAERAKEYAPPVWGKAGDISEIEKQRPKYMTVMTTVATRSPPNPYASPKFQPKKSPEMTAATPSAQSDQTPACRRSWRLPKYPSAASRYVTTPTFLRSATVAPPVVKVRCR